MTKVTAISDACAGAQSTAPQLGAPGFLDDDGSVVTTA